MRRATLILCPIFLVLAGTLTTPCRVRAYSSSAFAVAEPQGGRDARAPREGEQGHGKEREEIYHWINFVLLAGALVYLARKPLGEFFTARSAAVRKELEQGRRALETSQAQLRTVEEKLGRLEEEIAAFKAAAAREMESERQRLHEAAAAEAERIRQAARTQIELALRSAKLELRVQAAQQAVELAEEMIRQRLDEASRGRLFSRFMADLAAKRGSG